MSSYLLSCDCGKTVPVEMGQAGGQVTCTCGSRVDVPPLRQLRHLPRSTPAEERPTGSTWGVRQGVVAASLIVAAALLLWSTWVWAHEPTIPKFDPAERAEIVERQIKTPVGAWQAWIDFYRPMAERGIPLFQVANATQIEDRIVHAKFLRWMLWAFAGICGVVALSAVFWPKPVPVKSGRQ